MSEGQVGGDSGAVAATPAASAPAAAPVGEATGGVLDAVGSKPVVTDPVAAAGIDTTPPPAWAEGADAEDLAFLANKGLNKEGKSVKDLIKMARHTDAMKGVPADQLTRIPDFSKPEDVAEFNAKMGVPDSADKYEAIEIAIGDGALDTGILAGMSLKAQLRPDQHAILAQAIGEWANETGKSDAEARAADLEAKAVAFKNDLGQAYDSTIETADRAAQEFGMPNEVFRALVSAVGPEPIITFLANVGAKIGEHRPATDAQTNNDTSVGMSQTQAKMLQAELKADSAFFARMQAGDQAAIKKWNNVNAVASGRGIPG